MKKRLCNMWFDDFNELSDFVLDHTEDGLEVVNVVGKPGDWWLIYFEPYDNPID